MSSPPSPSSPSSEASLLAFSYDTGIVIDGIMDGAGYPHGHDESQPATPASPRTRAPAPVDDYFPQRSGRAATHPPSASSPAQAKHMRIGGREAEYEIGGAGDMDAFTGGELVVMSGSSAMVLALVVVAGLVIAGRIAL
jgi:hypothetical protein